MNLKTSTILVIIGLAIHICIAIMFQSGAMKYSKPIAVTDMLIFNFSLIQFFIVLFLKQK